MTMASGGCCNDGGDSICVFGTTVRLIIVPFAFTCMVLVLSTCFILHLPLFDLTVLFNRYSHVLCDERRLLGVRDAARLPSNRSIMSPLSLSIGYIYRPLHPCLVPCSCNPENTPCIEREEILILTSTSSFLNHLHRSIAKSSKRNSVCELAVALSLSLSLSF